MEIHHISMTGADLKNIYDISGLKGEDFAKRLGISRPTLYLLFKDEIVEESIQAKLEADKDLNEKYRQLFKPATQQPQVTAEGLYGSIDKLITILTNQLDEQKQNASALRRTNDSLIANNQHIREDSGVFREIVQMVLKAGGLKVDKAVLARMK
jgi:transcriptional regulator with XRE-family HTH domain